ncbi:hypothetical protein Mapa_010073 [Marchantia paleacea]|nr:hypothetical protein Mapa_010073 [Marchantia paleacea]
MLLSEDGNVVDDRNGADAAGYGSVQEPGIMQARIKHHHSSEWGLRRKLARPMYYSFDCGTFSCLNLVFCPLPCHTSVGNAPFQSLATSEVHSGSCFRSSVEGLS